MEQDSWDLLFEQVSLLQPQGSESPLLAWLDSLGDMQMKWAVWGRIPSPDWLMVSIFPETLLYKSQLRDSSIQYLWLYFVAAYLLAFHYK